MNQDQVKEMLLSIEESGTDFSVVFSGKKSRKVNGLYKPYEREILLHNKNFESDNQLVYTAIHEYAHHLLCVAAGGELSPRHHTAEFWARFHGLLGKAEAAGLYSVGMEASPELAALTEEIREKYLAENGRLMSALGKLLEKARALCHAAGIRYEDYIDRVLQLPRTAVKAAVKVSSLDVDTSMGYEAMKIVAAQRSPEKRALAQQMLSEGSSPDSVKVSLAKKEEHSPREKLEIEKQRLEKNIARLTARLEHVEQSLASL